MTRRNSDCRRGPQIDFFVKDTIEEGVLDVHAIAETNGESSPESSRASGGAYVLVMLIPSTCALP
jgi:hypothetical protein